ncbi:hypothetical protein M413DRAFT_49006, partial [Hebeloma cylindrosporum]
LGFWFPHTEPPLAFCAPTPSTPDSQAIFYYEALCVFCALREIAPRVQSHSRLLLYTDNMNTVQIFNSLACLPIYNSLLRHSVDILLHDELQLRVLHVPGDENIVADALSRCEFHRALCAVPDLKISPFQPPQWTLGAVQK